MLKFLIVVAFVPAIFASTPVRQCAGGEPLPDEVYFGSLETPCLAPPCEIVRSAGFAVTYVNFTTQNAASSILPRIRATVFSVITIVQELPTEIANNPCGIITVGSCPFAAGESSAYRLELPVDESTPLIASDTEITLFGDNSEVIFCYRLNTQLVD